MIERAGQHVTLGKIVTLLESQLEIGMPDYPGALNGVQLENSGAVYSIAAAVDFSTRAIEATITARANLLIVHHGMFWGEPKPIRGARYQQIRRLIQHDIAVYSAHLPLDAHPLLGNNALLAKELGLDAQTRFATYKDKPIGVAGEAHLPTHQLATRAAEFALRHGGTTRTTPIPLDRLTRRWAICTGAGASAETLREAYEKGIDTLIVGEGAHWTAVDAMDSNLTIIYAGHYATETLGVRAVAAWLSNEVGLPWHFIDAPTGL